jgi:hypothetical protein
LENLEAPKQAQQKFIVKDVDEIKNYVGFSFLDLLLLLTLLLIEILLYNSF